MKIIKQAIQKSLQEAADPVKAQYIEKYMKNVLPFRGLQAPAIQKVYKMHKSDVLQLNPTEQYKLVESLIMSEFGEDKNIGLLIASNLKFDLEKVKETEQWFTNGYIKEWASADGYCSRVLKGFLVDQENAKLMEEWSQHENLWMRRSSCVGFVTIIRKKQVDMEMLYRICATNIVHQERFNQLGTGWLLREMSQKDLGGVLKFIENNIQHFTTEGLRYAYEKMNRQNQNYLKALINGEKISVKVTKRTIK